MKNRCTQQGKRDLNAQLTVTTKNCDYIDKGKKAQKSLKIAFFGNIKCF